MSVQRLVPVLGANVKRVVITGGTGHCGAKLAAHLQCSGYQTHIFEHPDYFKAEMVPEGGLVTLCDLKFNDKYWASQLDGAAAVVHFAAVNPYPEASWQDSAESMDMQMNVFSAAKAAGVPRVVFASSNHVMGGHKDLGGVYGNGDGSNLLSDDDSTPPMPGTVWTGGGVDFDSTP
jgi:nucleoside-diphosphate-sugar epimerase